MAVLWGWVSVRGTGGHVFTAPRGIVIETDRGVALQLTAEPLTTHVVVAVLQWGTDRPQPWRDSVARAVYRDLPVLRATIWSWGAGRHLPGAPPWLRDCGDASPPPAEMRSALEGLYAAGSKPGPRHHFLVAADPTAELNDDAVALVADVVQCLPPPRHPAMMLPREGWEGQRHDQTAAAHLLAPDMPLTVDPLDRHVVAGAPPQWPHTWHMALRTMCMAPRGQRPEWPGVEHPLATTLAAQVQQPADNSEECGVCALMSALGTLLRVPRPGNLLSTLDRRWVAALVLNRDMGPIAHLPSLGELPAAVPQALPAPHTPLDVADVPHHVGLPGARMQHALLSMAAADGGMSMLMTVTLRHVKHAMQQQQLHAPQPWEENARRWLHVEGVPPTHTVGMTVMGKLVVLERNGVLGLCSGGSGGAGMGRHHRVPAQEAAVQGPGPLHGVQGMPPVTGPGAEGAQVHDRGNPTSGDLRLLLLRTPRSSSTRGSSWRSYQSKAACRNSTVVGDKSGSTCWRCCSKASASWEWSPAATAFGCNSSWARHARAC